MFDLTGKAAVVTGATGGIGAATARALHAQGARVAVTGRRLAELDALVSGLGERAVAVPADLADPAAPAALVERVEAEFGALDILVNNAGLTRDMLALRMGDADWAAVLEVDLTAPFRLARAALRGMMKRRHGRIVSIASHATPFSEAPIPSNGAANGVLELRAGRSAEINARPGDKVLHPYFKP